MKPALAALFVLLGALSAIAQDRETRDTIAALGLREMPTALRDGANWQPPRTIVVRIEDPALLPGLQSVAGDVKLIPVTSATEALRHVGAADALVGYCDPDLVAAGRRLRWIHAQQAGVEKCLASERLREGNIVLTNTQRLNGPNIAEHALALMLSLTRQIHAYGAHRAWNKTTYAGVRDLEGRTLLLVGLGGIGMQIAARAHAFGMNVIATRASSREGAPFISYVGLADELPALAPRADIVVNVAPLTAATAGMFNATVFDRFKPGAYFINVGRGGTVVTADLVRAIERRHLAGAGLDVVDPEPLPPDHVLWTMPNVIITPHVAGDSDDARRRVQLIMRENLRRYVAGDRLLSPVDTHRGY